MLQSIAAAFKEERHLRDDGPSGSACAGGKARPLRAAASRRRTLYRLVQEHVETFLAQVERQTGAGLPEFVKDEFNAFLECGILAHGFLRLRCADCAREKLIIFSCKRRGFCAACGARRMAETATRLVDHVIPRVPVRQWVLSFPIPLRLLFATDPQLLAPVLQILHRIISTFLIKQAGLKRTEAQSGAVTLIQRFGSAAHKIAGSDFEQPRAGPSGVKGRESPNNLNIHLHCLVLDGVYQTTEGLSVFHAARPPTPGELQALLRIIERLMQFLTRKGFLIEEQGMRFLADTDPDLARLHLIRFHSHATPGCVPRSFRACRKTPNTPLSGPRRGDAPSRGASPPSWARLLTKPPGAF